jgi:hypothetical protein
MILVCLGKVAKDFCYDVSILDGSNFFRISICFKMTVHTYNETIRSPGKEQSYLLTH